MSEEEKLKNKAGDWLLKKHEDRLKNFLVPKIPSCIETYHLTYLTLVWSFLIILCFYLSNQNYFYIWLVPIFAALQYLTDLLDGAVGRYRNTGLVKWGYYVDHFLDFIFMTSILFGYSLSIGLNNWIFILYAAISGFMIHTFLLVSTQNKFHISFLKIGPTEGRLIFIIFHLVIASKGIYILDKLLPYITIFSLLLLAIMVLNGQKILWKQDMADKSL